MRTVFFRAWLSVAALLAAVPAFGQGYPSKPIKVIVPYPAGGATDFFARLVFPKVGEALGQSVVVENRPGAGTAIGASEVARSAPDGYTLLLGDAGTYAFNPTLYKKLSYDPARDFAPVSLTGRFALILAVNPSVVKATSVKEFVAAAKAAPGKIDYGAPGPGSPIHTTAAHRIRPTAATQPPITPITPNPAIAMPSRPTARSVANVMSSPACLWNWCRPFAVPMNTA